MNSTHIQIWQLVLLTIISLATPVSAQTVIAKEQATQNDLHAYLVGQLDVLKFEVRGEMPYSHGPSSGLEKY